MKTATAVLVGLACCVWLACTSAGAARNWTPSPGGHCVDLDSITSDADGRTYFATYHSGTLSCRGERFVHEVAVDCSQALSVSPNDLTFYTYSEGSGRWEPSESRPDQAFAASLVFACVVNW